MDGGEVKGEGADELEKRDVEGEDRIEGTGGRGSD
jgi:hypothetical protein